MPITNMSQSYAYDKCCVDVLACVTFQHFMISNKQGGGVA